MKETTTNKNKNWNKCGNLGDGLEIWAETWRCEWHEWEIDREGEWMVGGGGQ